MRPPRPSVRRPLKRHKRGLQIYRAMQLWAASLSALARSQQRPGDLGSFSAQRQGAAQHRWVGGPALLSRATLHASRRPLPAQHRHGAMCSASTAGAPPERHASPLNLAFAFEISNSEGKPPFGLATARTQRAASSLLWPGGPGSHSSVTRPPSCTAPKHSPVAVLDPPFEPSTGSTTHAAAAPSRVWLAMAARSCSRIPSDGTGDTMAGSGCHAAAAPITRRDATQTCTDRSSVKRWR